MRTTDRVFGYAILTVCPGQTLEKCAVFLFFRERVWEKRRRRFRFAGAVQKRSCGVRWEAKRHNAFLSRTIPWGSLLASLGVFSGTSLILSRLLFVGLSDFAKQMAAMPHH